LVGGWQGFDASNKDSAEGKGMVNMQPWNVFGMRMPDTVKSFMAGNGKEYLVISNEGDDKEYVWDNDAVWTEMVRGKVSSSTFTAKPFAPPTIQEYTRLISIVVGLLH
jgi:hypothetical protein